MDCGVSPTWPMTATPASTIAWAASTRPGLPPVQQRRIRECVERIWLRLERRLMCELKGVLRTRGADAKKVAAIE
eukprot:365666-Chlamydomonas_euryale.AAC.2